MYTRILNTWSNFRSSFWFVPTVLMFLATITSFGMIHFDQRWGKGIADAYPMFNMSPPAARSILSTIVGAMVSTTGVVFSITIVALSLSSSQFGSRLIRTYRNRRTTHFTLGIFVSTSLFCILVLTSIREFNDYVFVPTTSVIIGILLTVVCLGTLVYYIHDMSQAIQAPNVIQQSANDLDNAIERLFPGTFGKQVARDATKEQLQSTSLKSIEENLDEPDFSVACTVAGYVQAIENESVMGIANGNGLTIRLLIRPGDFLFEDRPLADVWCNSDGQKENFAESKMSICKSISNSLIIGPNRTHMQDIRYAFDELVDIAVRALSPGVNDPFTAVNCVDRIHAALIVLQKRTAPSEYRLNDDGELRVVASPVSIVECIEGSLGVISDYADGNPMVEKRIAKAYESLEG
ncbi:MAG: DUF2254 domain-containing protein [Mariniblastus sp.]